MKIVLTNDEARLLIDTLKGEEMRLHRAAASEEADTEGDWFQKRVDEVATLKAYLKAKLV